MKIEIVSENKFDASEAPILFDKDEFSQIFGLLIIEYNMFRIAWRSTLISPILLEVKEDFVFIGIDNSFAAIRKSDNSVVNKLSLVWNFSFFKIVPGLLLVVSELDIHVFEVTHLALVKYVALPDIIDSVNFLSDGHFEVLCMDNKVYNFSI